MKSNRISVFVLISMAMTLTGAVLANDFQGLTYQLEYPSAEGRFALAIDLPLGSWDIDLTLPLVADMPGQYLTDAMNRFCDPTSPEFDPALCGILHTILSSDALAWLNSQWNTTIETLLGILPMNITTNQLPWPMDRLGFISIHNYNDFPWLCSWDTDTGDYTLQPFHIENTESPGYGIEITRIYDFGGNGRIDRDNDYRLDGLYDYSISQVIAAGDVNVSLTIGLPANCTAQPL
ncbi:hypothetical protein JW823_09770 [bacterium]|nr:hypothetical protein [candidate division CSSED10-310 bacterium]